MDRKEECKCENWSKRCAHATLAALSVAACLIGVCAMAASAALPDGRRYELVSPPDKNGADVLLTTERTRVAADGNAFGFAALAGFGDARAVAVASDYVSVRSTMTNPGSSGWSTHGVTPVQRALSLGDTLAGQEPLYTGPYSRDLSTGVFFADSPLTADPMVSDVPNLYRRTDLLTPGPGAYELLTACPLCDARSTPLDPSGDSNSRARARPVLAGASPDFRHVVFESSRALTADAPPQPAACVPTRFPFSAACGMRLYEWDDGTLRLAGILPDGTPADASFAGEGASHFFRTPGVVSDGSDGHSRIFFTQPTDESGTTLSQAPDLGTAIGINQSPSGNLYMRVDHATTEQLNLSERTTPDAFAPARFIDASADGTRAFFMTSQALTDDAPADGQQKIYMYDAGKPGTDPHNLTFVNRDSEPADGTGNAFGGIGVSRDGHYFYFISDGALISGGPLNGQWIYLWHDGSLNLVGPAPPTSDASFELLATDVAWVLSPQQSRVSADGRTLLFSSTSGVGLTGYDHGSCESSLGFGCRELYVYTADGSTPLRPVIACASCNPSGAAAVGMATDFVGDNTIGGTRSDPPNSQALTDDGSRVFFSSPDALVPEDTNGRYDAYEYDVRTRTVALLTTGKSTSDSYAINASPSGDDAFVITREQLVGWDVDQAYDLYDARVNGGFPEPPAPAPACGGDACHGLPVPPPAYAPPDSSSFLGTGDQTARLKPHRKSIRCRRGTVLRRVRGRRRCVKVVRHRHKHRGKAARRHGRRS